MPLLNSDRLIYPALLLAGAAASLGFEPLNLWPLTLLGFAFLIDRVWRAVRPIEVLLQAGCFGLGHFLVGLNWIATAFTYQSRMPVWLGPLAVVLLSAYLALYPALTCIAVRCTQPRTKLGWVLILCSAWIAGEWLRSVMFTGFPWNPLAAIWLAVPPVALIARWVGTYGMSGLVIAASGALWIAIGSYPRTVTGLATALLLYSCVSHTPLTHMAYATSDLPVWIVQPNISQADKYDPMHRRAQVETYLRLSAGPSSKPHVLLWPEAATLSFLELEGDARRELATALGPEDLLLIGGESYAVHGEADIYHNSVFALDPGATLRWRYDKAHLVPFGEYLPSRPALQRIGLSRLVPGEGDFTPGPGPRTFPLPGFTIDSKPATVGIQLCYEIAFSGHVIDRSHRPSFLFNPSNDAWFGAWGPPQHLAQARLRAIEEGISVVRATANGISAIIDPSGALVATIPPHQQGVIHAFVPQPLAPTVFARWGLWVSGVFGAFLGLVGYAYEYSTRHRKPIAQAPIS